jgi:hypothetical protein
MMSYAEAKKQLELSKALLCELDVEIEKVLAVPVEHAFIDTALESNQMPFFYGMVGANREPGVVFDDVINPSVQSGRIEIQNDGPFVVTDIMAVGKTLSGGSQAFGPDGQPQPGYTGLTAGVRVPDDTPGAFGFQFTIQGSGRRLFQGNNETTREETFIPASLFDILKRDDSSKGPNFGYRLPQSLILAKNDVVKVDIRYYGQGLDSFFSGIPPFGVFLTFAGYKVLEE